MGSMFFQSMPHSSIGLKGPNASSQFNFIKWAPLKSFIKYTLNMVGCGMGHWQWMR